MWHSVRGRLLFNTILVSMATILIVGVVALLLLNATFKQQEEAYLQAQAQQFAPVITQTLLTNNLLELQRVAAVSSFANQTRIQVYSHDWQLVADSGSPQEIKLFNPIELPAPDVLMGIVVDENGRIIRITPPLSRQTDPTGGINLSFLDPGTLLGTEDAFTDVSAMHYRMPLVINDQIIGYLALSEGPAVGVDVMRSIWLALFAGSLMALLLAITMGLVAARQITQPLIVLETAVQSMGDDDLTARAPHSQLQEYDHLASEFNTMAERLSATISRLQTEREVLRHTITDASHELRTPLTALKTFNTLLADELETAGSAHNAHIFVQESSKQITQLEQLTSAMLDLSRLETRLQGTNFVTADLRETITAAINILAPLAKTKNLSLRTNLPDQPLLYAHDPATLQRAIGNLIHNAIKFSPTGGKIQISLQTTAADYRISIQDEGIGIAPQVQERIFDRFYRGADQTVGGSGLGLAICQEIVRIHNGRIHLESEPNIGSTFTIILEK
ncbi:MAG: HAMP domain-containing histidine kinase [Anaerolineales bacterium]|nr:HAMP domain-containing histidine kinase [Anaerolineales bacterium]